MATAIKRKGDAAPVKLGTFTRTPAIDTPLLLFPDTPEQRVYTVQPVIRNVEIGYLGAPFA